MKQGPVRPRKSIIGALILLSVVAASFPAPICAEGDSPAHDPSPAEESDHPSSVSSPPSAAEPRWHAPRKNARTSRPHLLSPTKDD